MRGQGYKVYTELDDRYYAILGSQNGASTMRILLDHKAQIGFRTVEKIILFECRNVGDEKNEDLARNFARQKDYWTVLSWTQPNWSLAPFHSNPTLQVLSPHSNFEQ